MSDEQTFEKTLTANDAGETDSHQAGIHIPKGQKELLAFLPELDKTVKNPDAWLKAVDDTGMEWDFRYIHYNNKHHCERGTRDEFRITHMTKALRALGAKEGDTLVFSGLPRTGRIHFCIRSDETQASAMPKPIMIKLSGWRKVH